MRIRERLARTAMALLGRDSFPDLSPYLFGQPWLHAFTEELNNAQAACKVATVNSCLSLISNDLAGLPMRFYSVRGEKWTDLDESHELPTLWDYGNPSQTGYEVRRDWFAFWDTTGDSALYMARGPSGTLKPYELWATPGHLLHEVPGVHRSVTEYEYLPTRERLRADNFATLRHWNPSVSPLEPSPRGMSPLTAAKDDYETLYRQHQWTRRFFEVGGRVATALRPLDKDVRLMPEQRKAIQEDFARLALGIKNLEKVPILDGLEPVPLGLTMQEMQHDQVAKGADLSVCRVLHVPPVLLGIKEGGGLSDAGATTDLLLYADQCLRPRARLISAVVTKYLCAAFGKEFRAFLDVDALMALQKAKLEQAKGLVTLTGRPILDVDEAREQLEYDPAPNGQGKGLWVSFNMVPSEIGAEPPPDPVAPAVKPEVSQARRAALSDDPKARLRRSKDADLRRYERRVSAWARTRFGRQEDAALARLESEGVRASRLLRAAYSADDLLPPDDDATEAQRMFEALIAERGEAAAAEVAAEVALNVHQGRIADMIQNRAAQFIKQIDETTRERLAGVIEDIVREGGSYEDLVKSVRQVFSDRRANAATIARTETAWAYNLASKETWSEAGIEYVSWLTVGDDRVRDSCLEAEAAGILKMGETFPNGCQFPGDPMGLPEYVINCFPAGTAMQGSVVAASRVEYVGPMREIVTRSGLRLSVTPNHPVLTAQGFVPASALVQGDDVLRHGREVEQAGAEVADEQHAPARIEDVFDAIRQEGSASTRDARSRDFHGDGAFTKGNVEVVLRHRELLVNDESTLSQDGGKGVLVGAAVSEPIPASSGPSDANLQRVGHAAAGSVCGSDLPSADAGAHTGPLHPLRIGLAAHLDASRFEGGRERAASDTGFVAEMLERGAYEVSLDEVVEVRDFHFSGHVYDLQSDKGWIVANGIVCCNCRCVLQPEFNADGSLARMFDRSLSLADLFETASGNGVAH